MIQTPLMVINNLDIFWPLARPNKAHAKLIVNANAVLPGAIMFQCLQSIAGWDTKIVKNTCPLNLNMSWQSIETLPEL